MLHLFDNGADTGRLIKGAFAVLAQGSYCHIVRRRMIVLIDAVGGITDMLIEPNRSILPLGLVSRVGFSRCSDHNGNKKNPRRG